MLRVKRPLPTNWCHRSDKGIAVVSSKPASTGSARTTSLTLPSGVETPRAGEGLNWVCHPRRFGLSPSPNRSHDHIRWHRYSVVRRRTCSVSYLGTIIDLRTAIGDWQHCCARSVFSWSEGRVGLPLNPD